MLRGPIPKALRFRAFRVFRGEPPGIFSVISACSVVSHSRGKMPRPPAAFAAQFPRRATTDRTDCTDQALSRRIRGQ